MSVFPELELWLNRVWPTSHHIWQKIPFVWKVEGRRETLSGGRYLGTEYKLTQVFRLSEFPGKSWAEVGAALVPIGNTLKIRSSSITATFTHLKDIITCSLKLVPDFKSFPDRYQYVQECPYWYRYFQEWAFWYWYSSNCSHQYRYWYKDCHKKCRFVSLNSPHQCRIVSPQPELLLFGDS